MTESSTIYHMCPRTAWQTCHEQDITKLDVLSDLDEIKVGVAYRLPDGTTLPAFPSNLDIMEKCEVVYDVLPGWKEDISKVENTIHQHMRRMDSSMQQKIQAC